MAIRFDPTAKEETKDNEFEPWRDGWYPAVVQVSEEGESRAGRQQIKVELEVFDDGNGKKQKIWDYIGADAIWKIEQYMNACGLGDEFMSGEFEADTARGKDLFVKLGTQPAKDGYKAKNTVKQYAKEPPQPKDRKPSAKPAGVPVSKQNAAKKAAAQAGDEEIPF